MNARHPHDGPRLFAHPQKDVPILCTVGFAPKAAHFSDEGTAHEIEVCQIIDREQHLGTPARLQQGDNISLYVNGTRVGTATNAITKVTNRTIVNIGQDVSSNWYAGYASGLRFIRGSGAYTASSSTITVPTTPPTAVANTVLLINGTNSAIFDHTAKNVMETTGDTKISTAQSKFGGSAIYFDGTGDSLLFPNPVIHRFGTGDFTVELWVYPVAWDSNMVVVMGNGSTGFGIQKYGGGSTGNIGVIINGAWAITDATLPTTGQWTHIAVTRTSGTLRFFVNGSVSGSTPSNTSDISGGISGIGGYSGQTYYNGYMDELRITKGVARYTTTFTPPTKAFQNK